MQPVQLKYFQFSFNVVANDSACRKHIDKCIGTVIVWIFKNFTGLLCCWIFYRCCHINIICSVSDQPNDTSYQLIKGVFFAGDFAFCQIPDHKRAITNAKISILQRCTVNNVFSTDKISQTIAWCIGSCPTPDLYGFVCCCVDDNWNVAGKKTSVYSHTTPGFFAMEELIAKISSCCRYR